MQLTTSDTQSDQTSHFFETKQNLANNTPDENLYSKPQIMADMKAINFSK